MVGSGSSPLTICTLFRDSFLAQEYITERGMGQMWYLLPNAGQWPSQFGWLQVARLLLVGFGGTIHAVEVGLDLSENYSSTIVTSRTGD